MKYFELIRRGLRTCGSIFSETKIFYSTNVGKHDVDGVRPLVMNDINRVELMGAIDCIETKQLVRNPEKYYVFLRLSLHLLNDHLPGTVIVRIFNTHLVHKASRLKRGCNVYLAGFISEFSREVVELDDDEREIIKMQYKQCIIANQIVDVTTASLLRDNLQKMEEMMQAAEVDVLSDNSV